MSDTNDAQAKPQKSVNDMSTGDNENTKKQEIAVEKGKGLRKRSLPEDLYEAASAHFLASYRNPLEEEVQWEKPKIRIPIIWWILFFLSALASALVVAITFLFPELVDIPHLHSISRPLLTFMVVVIVFVGLTITFLRLRKPPFWNKFHTIYTLTGFLWGFGGVSGLSSLVVTAWVDWSYVTSDVGVLVSLILPISLWAGGVLIIPPVVALWLVPAWERHAPLIRLGVINVFWGAYAGVILTLVAPYISRENPLLSFVMLVFATLPVAGVFTAGIVVCLPVRLSISFTAFLNYILGILLVAFGVAVILSYVLIDNTPLAGTIFLTVMMLVMAALGLWAVLGISQAPDPLLKEKMANLQTWVDADVISPDEQEFMCSELIIAEWGRMALRRGVFLAARDYYRAVMQLAFLEFGDENAQVLVNTVHTTRRKLEAAGIPPRVNFKQFADAPIFPDLLG